MAYFHQITQKWGVKTQGTEEKEYQSKNIHHQINLEMSCEGGGDDILEKAEKARRAINTWAQEE